MMYLYLAVFVVGSLAGFTLSHAIDEAEILRMQIAIEAQKKEAATTLATEQQKTANATIAALKSNEQLEQSHNAYIQTANDYHTQLANIDLNRLLNAGRRARGDCPVPKTGSSDKPIVQAEHNELSGDFAELLRRETYRADTVAAYADECWKFITSNCGIQ